jgi:hypothetical protein
LCEQQPEKYGEAAQLLLDGVPAKAAAKRARLDCELVKFIARQHPEIRAARRKVVIGNLEESIVALSTRLSDEADEVPVREVARTLSVAIDKLATLTGNVQATVAIQHHASREQVLAMYDEIRRSKDEDGKPADQSQEIRNEPRQVNNG